MRSAHSPTGAAVTVTAWQEDDAIAIAIANEGEGIASDDQLRILEPGVRATTARAGSGLGLSVVRTVALAHGGRVEVRSSPGQGATFTLVLPAACGGR